MLCEQYMDAVNQFVADNEKNVIRDIKRLVAIPSVEGTPEPGKPFGPGPAAALTEILKMADEMGFATHNENNYIGWAEMKGESGKQITTITHVDVVPTGEGWDHDPFDLVEKNGWLIGRGVTDDKGPSILCLYALKFLKEHNIHLKHDIRTLFGANEETGMGDVDYYLKNFPAPDFCFSPDADFPVCNGEKGAYGATLVSKELHGNILEFVGGVANNVIPDRASCLVKADISKLSEREGITLEEENGNVRIRGWGKSGHASVPEGTVNAIGLIVDYLLDNNLGDADETAFLEFLRILHHGTDGSGVGIAASDNAFDPLTIIGGVMRTENGHLLQQVDSRFPTTITSAQISERLVAASKGTATIQDVDAEEPFYISADHPAIQALVDTYNLVTGEKSEPFTMGGGTYARHFPVAVSFGPEHSDTVLPDFAGAIHSPNEGCEIKPLMEALKIYIMSLIRLQEVEL